jgi:hypothetical protein
MTSQGCSHSSQRASHWSGYSSSRNVLFPSLSRRHISADLGILTVKLKPTPNAPYLFWSSARLQLKAKVGELPKNVGKLASSPLRWTMAKAPPNPCHLLELSNEILTLIATAIYEQVDLRNLSNTCHALHRIVDPLLYRRVNIRTIASCDRFSQVVLSHPGRAWEVHSLNIHILCYNEDPEDLDGTFVGYLRKLRELNIRFPGLPDGVQGALVEDIGKTQRFISLHSLRTCE